MLVLESRQPRREIASKEVQRHTEANKTGENIVGHRSIGFVIELQDAPRIWYELAALGCQLDHAAFAARQQTPADLGLEFGNLLADGRLRPADALGGARNTHGVGDDHK